jgi:hypothetical protein
MRDPGRAVLIEGRDARFWRNEFRARLVGGRLDQIDDGLLGRTVVPGRQRVGLRVRVDANSQQGEERDGPRARRANKGADKMLLKPPSAP